jgi:hypothetical protein
MTKVFNCSSGNCRINRPFNSLALVKYLFYTTAIFYRQFTTIIFFLLCWL